jgi:hypothetical protein
MYLTHKIFFARKVGKFKEQYEDMKEWNIRCKENVLKISIDDCANMKHQAKKIGARPYNRCEVYDKCDRLFQVVLKKRDKKAVYDKLAGAILAKNVKNNY